MWDTENTLSLIRQSQGGSLEARERLLNENAPLIKSIVKRYLGRGADFDDLFQLGNIGLLKAIQGFDASYNVRFSTYAVPLIIGEIKRYIRDNNTVKMPRSLKEMQTRLRYAHQTLTAQLNREPHLSELMKEVNASREDVILALDSMNTCASLDEPAYSDSDISLADTVEDKSRSASFIDKMALRECIGQLDERERKIILLRYYRNYTQTKIAEMLGISQVQISRIESRALEKLRKKMG